MRLTACLGVVLLGASACTHLPANLRVDLDGNSVEFRKKPVAPEAPQPEEGELEAPVPEERPADARHG